MAVKEGNIVAKPNEINEWIVWDDLTESVLINFETDVWDEDKQDYFLEVEHRPTTFMKFAYQIDENKEPTYDRTSDTFKTRFPMSKVALVKSRTEGSSILMLCNYKGVMGKLVEQVNRRILDENEKLKEELKSKNASIVRNKALITQMAKHPEEFEKIFTDRLMNLRKSTAPAYFGGSGQGMSAEGEEKEE